MTYPFKDFSPKNEQEFEMLMEIMNDDSEGLDPRLKRDSQKLTDAEMREMAKKLFKRDC